MTSFLIKFLNKLMKITIKKINVILFTIIIIFTSSLISICNGIDDIKQYHEKNYFDRFDINYSNHNNMIIRKNSNNNYNLNLNNIKNYDDNFSVNSDNKNLLNHLANNNDYDNDDNVYNNDHRQQHKQQHKFNNHNLLSFSSLLPLSSWYGNENFILTDYLTDGELERRISYNGITAKETSIGYNSSDLLSLWQISDGKRFIQLIYSNGKDLIDCEYIREKGLVKKFLKDFYMDVELVFRSRNFTPSSSSIPTSVLAETVLRSDNSKYQNNDHDYHNEKIQIIAVPSVIQTFEDHNSQIDMRNLHYRKIVNDNDIPEEIRSLLNYNELKLECYRRHEQMKQITEGLNSNDETVRRDANKELQRKKRDLSDWLIAPNTKWCGKGHNAGKYNQLGGASRADKCCRKHDHCKMNIHGLTTKWQVFNYFPFTISHCSCDMRHRRDLSNLLRIPGTKWCGKGYSAVKYSELGGYSKADRCCRQHDKSCPFWIMGFETKYGLFNWRVSTLMHCKCDERFRTCLKMADSADANMVGKLFFNIVQTKCFVLKTEKVCKKRSWWGKCEKRIKRKRAHLRDNRKF